MKMVLRSVPGFEVQDGGFRCMERGTTMIFLDFVTGNVKSLLIYDFDSWSVNHLTVLIMSLCQIIVLIFGTKLVNNTVLIKRTGL